MESGPKLRVELVAQGIARLDVGAVGGQIGHEGGLTVPLHRGVATGDIFDVLGFNDQAHRIFVGGAADGEGLAGLKHGGRAVGPGGHQIPVIDSQGNGVYVGEQQSRGELREPVRAGFGRQQGRAGDFRKGGGGRRCGRRDAEDQALKGFHFQLPRRADEGSVRPGEVKESVEGRGAVIQAPVFRVIGVGGVGAGVRLIIGGQELPIGFDVQFQATGVGRNFGGRLVGQGRRFRSLGESNKKRVPGREELGAGGGIRAKVLTDGVAAGQGQGQIQLLGGQSVPLEIAPNQSRGVVEFVLPDPPGPGLGFADVVEGHEEAEKTEIDARFGQRGLKAGRSGEVSLELPEDHGGVLIKTMAFVGFRAHQENPAKFPVVHQLGHEFFGDEFADGKAHLMDHH